MISESSRDNSCCISWRRCSAGTNRNTATPTATMPANTKNPNDCTRSQSTCQFVATGLEFSSIDRMLPKHLFDAQQLVVLANPVSPTERAGLDLAGIRRDRD